MRGEEDKRDRRTRLCETASVDRGQKLSPSGGEEPSGHMLLAERSIPKTNAVKKHISVRALNAH